MSNHKYNKGVLQINSWRAWDIYDKGFFISKADETGTIWINLEDTELEDLRELIRRVKYKLSQKTGRKGK